MKFEKIACLGLLLVGLNALAQAPIDPDWKESDSPPPPSFDSARLIPIAMPSYVSLRFGIDPQTLAITPDGIIRYVMVASNASGSINAMYEGLRCASREVKTYARYNSSREWSVVTNPQWKELNSALPSKHALALAQQGACEGFTPTGSAAAIINALKNTRSRAYE